MWPQFSTIILLLGFFSHAIAAAEMSAEQRRGQQIYLYGSNVEGGAIQAHLNTGNVQIPASLVPCVNCHGHDGRGKPEGGYVPSDLRWEVLTRPYNVTQPSGRQHKPYQEKTLKKAITMGLDPSGNTLNAIMPRYHLTHQDMSDLIAYLKGLGGYSVAGVNDTSIKIGIILSRSNHKATATKQILRAYFEELNTKGGIYQRKIELSFVNAPKSDDASLRQFRDRLDSADLFAFVASELDGIQPLTGEYCEKSGVPVVGAFSQYPDLDFPLNRYVFYLFSGYKMQSLSLAAFSRQQYAVNTEKIRIISTTDGYFSQAAEQLAATWVSQQPPEIVVFGAEENDLSKMVETLHDNRIEQIYFVGNTKIQDEFIDAADRRQWRPRIFLPGAHMSSKLLNSARGFDRRIFVALPALPHDYDPQAIADYKRLVAEYGLPKARRNIQLWAIASANLLVEGLTRAGRNLDQEKLIEVLEGLYRFDTELTKPVTFGPNRRLGISGSYIVNVDLLNKTIVPVSDWVNVR